MVFEKNYWMAADYAKRRLFNRLREETQRINYLKYDEYKRSFEAIYDSLIDEWKKVLEGFEDNPDFSPIRLEGYLLEALFYYACLKTQANFMDAEIVEMEGAEFKESPPWFEATPLYDIIAPLHHTTEAGVRKRRAPQTRADFLVTYVSDEGPLAPSMFDVKVRKPSRWRPEWSWQIIAALRRGFTFQIAYPKSTVKYPKNLDEWETATPCSNCKELSKDLRKCSWCGSEIFPFTMADAYYESLELWKRLGKDRKGRF